MNLVHVVLEVLITPAINKDRATVMLLKGVGRGNDSQITLK